MKYRVHAFLTFRVSYDMEAESPEEVTRRVRDWHDMGDPVEARKTDEMPPNIIIDPILPNGEVDYEGRVNARTDEEEQKP